MFPRTCFLPQNLLLKEFSSQRNRELQTNYFHWMPPNQSTQTKPTNPHFGRAFM